MAGTTDAPTYTRSMHVIGFCGYSGSGKTTLIEQLIARLRLAGQRVSVVKHAHHAFDIDHEGKDSWRHRQAGAFDLVRDVLRGGGPIGDLPILGAANASEFTRAADPRGWVLDLSHADRPRA